MKFEWDTAKAEANLRKHGVSFENAAQAFEDIYGVEEIDERFDYGEERYILTAIVYGMLINVTFTLREEEIRIISAREATKYEQDRYYRENARRRPLPEAD